MFMRPEIDYLATRLNSGDYEFKWEYSLARDLGLEFAEIYKDDLVLTDDPGYGLWTRSYICDASRRVFEELKVFGEKEEPRNTKIEIDWDCARCAVVRDREKNIICTPDSLADMLQTQFPRRLWSNSFDDCAATNFGSDHLAFKLPAEWSYGVGYALGELTRSRDILLVVCNIICNYDEDRHVDFFEYEPLNRSYVIPKRLHVVESILVAKGLTLLMKRIVDCLADSRNTEVFTLIEEHLQKCYWMTFTEKFRISRSANPTRPLLILCDLYSYISRVFDAAVVAHFSRHIPIEHLKPDGDSVVNIVYPSHNNRGTSLQFRKQEIVGLSDFSNDKELWVLQRKDRGPSLSDQPLQLLIKARWFQEIWGPFEKVTEFHLSSKPMFYTQKGAIIPDQLQDTSKIPSHVSNLTWYRFHNLESPLLSNESEAYGFSPYISLNGLMGICEAEAPKSL